MLPDTVYVLLRIYNMALNQEGDFPHEAARELLMVCVVNMEKVLHWCFLALPCCDSVVSLWEIQFI